MRGTAQEVRMNVDDKRFRLLREELLARIVGPDETSGVSPYIARIEGAAQALALKSARVRELEEEIYALKRQHAETNARLDDANKYSARVERELVSQKNRVARAEGLAVAAIKRGNELKEALAAADTKLAGL